MTYDLHCIIRRFTQGALVIWIRNLGVSAIVDTISLTGYTRSETQIANNPLHAIPTRNSGHSVYIHTSLGQGNNRLEGVIGDILIRSGAETGANTE